jgi:hypothetical protein
VAYYDLIFERDVSREVDFITAAYWHYAGREPAATLEVACGPVVSHPRLGPARSVGYRVRPNA